MYKLVWFITNIFFVVSLVSSLFLHRAVNMEKMQSHAQQDGYSKLKKLTTFRKLLIASTVIFFITMCVSFLADMRVNG